MILQNNQKVHPEIKRIGCLFLSLGRIVELETGREFVPEEVDTVWMLCKKLKYIDDNLCVKNPDKVLEIYAVQAGLPYLKIFQVGIERNCKTTFWQWVDGNAKFKNYKYKIEKVLTPGPEGTHFRLCNKEGKLLFDSYSFREYKHQRINEYTLYAVI